MNSPLPEDTLRVSTEKRILNEFASKILNEERMSKVIDERGRSKHLSTHSAMLFHCECDDPACDEVISISTEEYAKVHHKTKQFIVVNAHVRFDIEEVIEQLGSYSLVEKYFPNPNKGAA